MFTHDPHPGVRAPAEAAAAEFAKYPDITVIEKKHIEVPGPLDFARSLMQDLLTAHPDGEIQGVWAGWDEPAMGAVQATDAAGRKILPSWASTAPTLPKPKFSRVATLRPR